MYIKEIDDKIHVYAERFYGHEILEYTDSWEIIFEKDEQSDYDCHIVSMTTIDDIKNNTLNEKYIEGFTKEEWTGKIEEFAYNFSENAFLSYALIDINQDGIEELVVRETTSEFLGTDSFYVFTEKNGQAVQLSSALNGFYPELYYSKARRSIVAYTRTSSNMIYYYSYDKWSNCIVNNISIMWERDYTDGIEVVKYYLYGPRLSEEQFYEHDYMMETIGDNPKWKEYVDELEEIVFSPL